MVLCPAKISKMKYVIIGGVAGGASAAARMRRLDEQAEIIIFEKGAYVSYANCGLPYYIGDVISDRNKLLLQTVTSFRQRFNIDVRVMSEVTAIDKEQKRVKVKTFLPGKPTKKPMINWCWHPAPHP